MSSPPLARWFAAGILLLTLTSLPSPGQTTSKKYALIVGINQYDHDRLTKLQFAVNDATQLALVLLRAGYQVTLLTDSATAELKPTRTNIERHLHRVMTGFRKGDTVVIALAGHGLQFSGDKDAYFCPSDAKPFKTRTDSLVSLKRIYQELEESVSGTKVLLVDACRDDPDATRRSRGVDADSAPPPPRGVAALFSCSAGQKALENPNLQHGVFFYHILKGLEGAAKNGAGEITYNGLAEHVMRQVPATVRQLTRGEGVQEPNQKTDIRGIPILIDSIRLPQLVAAGELLARSEFAKYLNTRIDLFMAALKKAEDGSDRQAATLTGIILDGEFVRKVVADGWMTRLAKSGKSHRELVDEMFVATLHRLPSEKERQEVLPHLKKQTELAAGLEDTFWALVNTREFLFRLHVRKVNPRPASQGTTGNPP